jgi:UDP-N-acetylglucosamine:LPS N-acetylglucosamine transferase
MRMAYASDVGDSGHKSVCLAIVEEGVARNHTCEEFGLWPEGSVVARDVLFRMFREYANRRLPGLPPVIEEPGLEPEMALDMMPGLSLPDVDVLIGVHPWAAYFFAELAERDGFEGPIIAVNTDFYEFPALAHPRIDIYTGVFPKLVLPPAHRARQRAIGMPVRSGFRRPGPPAAERNLIVAAVGARPFIPLDDVLTVCSALQRRLPDVQVVVCAGREPADSAPRSTPSNIEMRHGATDLSDLMTKARFVITRPSGATVAEAIAAGAVPVLLPSDVPWEADAGRHLVYEGLAVPLPAEAEPIVEAVAALWTDADRIGAIVAAGRRLELDRSAERLWELAEAGRPAPVEDPRAFLDPAEAELLEGYLRTLDEAQGGDPMPRTAAFLRRAMLDWYAT